MSKYLGMLIVGVVYLIGHPINQENKLKAKVIVTLLFLIGISVIYVFLRPEYSITHYEFKNCPNVTLTRIEYNKIGKRGVIFAYGKIEEKSIPHKESLIGSFLGGLDSNYQVVATCTNNQITINYISGYYKETNTNARIFQKRVKTGDFYELQTNRDNLYIEGY